MKYVFSILVVIISFNLKGQAYMPLVEKNTYWDVTFFCGYNYNSFCGICYKNRYFLSGDTVIYGKTYKKINKYNFLRDTSFPLPNYCPINIVDTVSYPLNMFIREDTTERKVWYYDDHIFSNYPDCIINNEVLLYDFGVHKGDTLKCISTTYNNCGFQLTLDTIKYESVFGVNRRVFYCKTPGTQSLYYKITEGIGGSEGAGGLYETIRPGYGFGYSLNCYSKFDSLGNFLFGGECAGFNNSIKDVYNRENIQISPNPFDDKISISFLSVNANKGKYQVCVYNSQGILIQNNEIEPEDDKKELTILLPHYKPGIYFFVIKNVQQRFFSSKIVKR